MCTLWTMTRLVRWRVRDWASCFVACRLSLDEEPASPPRVPVRNMVFDKKKDNRVDHICKKKLKQPKCNKNKQLNSGTEKDKDLDGISAGNMIDDSSWTLSADEDYIVFCFGGDGEFDVVRDGKSVNSEPLSGLDGKPRNSRPVNRKLNYGEDAEQVVNQNIHEERSNANLQDTDQQDQHCITHNMEVQDEEKEIIYMGRQKHRESIRRTCQIEEIVDRGVVSADSRDSNQSEGSTGSFAFPVLGWEWIGSPAQMPQSEGQHLRKQKVRSLRFQCCRF